MATGCNLLSLSASKSENTAKRKLDHLDGNLVKEVDDKNCKKKKIEAMKDFKLIKILGEDARNKTLILHLQGIQPQPFSDCQSRRIKAAF